MQRRLQEDRASDLRQPAVWKKISSVLRLLPRIDNVVLKTYLNEALTKKDKSDCYKVIYVLNGNGIYDSDNDGVIQIESNDLLIVSPLTNHRTYSFSRSVMEAVELSFSFKSESGDASVFVPLYDFMNLNTDDVGTSVFMMKINRINSLVDIFMRLADEQKALETDNTTSGNTFLQQLLLMEFFVIVSKLYENERESKIKAKTAKAEQLVEIAKVYIEKNYERHLDLTGISNHVFLSPSYFNRVFKKYTGITPVRFLLDYRLKKAEEMLINTNLKVSDIINNVGFSNQQRFNQLFKKHTGLTPSEYRRENKR